MLNRFFSLISAAMLVLAAACTNEEFTAKEIASGDEISISATLEGPNAATLENRQDATKTSLNTSGKVLWTSGDAFALLTESSKDRFELTDGAGTASASFYGTVTGTAPFYAFYPYSESCKIEGGAVKFHLPQEQAGVNGSFASGASPAIATLASATGTAHFKNLCGVLEIQICGSSKIKSLEVINLDGKPLWGDCSVALDGKEGTNEQTMSITGGSNVIKVVFEKYLSLLNATPRVIDVVVPAGSCAKGFSLRVFDMDGKAISFLTAQKPELKIARSYITSLDKVKIPSNGEPKDTCLRGYYKDLFMNSGCHLTSNTSLPAASYLGWTMDYMATSDSLFQESVITKSDLDDNGAILYPDSEPRYRVVYVNGGKATSHVVSLNLTGRSRLVNFSSHGGCYVGSCAGAFLAGNGASGRYLCLFPCPVAQTGLTKAYTGMNIPNDSPLLKYYDFGGDFYVDSVYHNGGCYMPLTGYLPEDGEILATFDMEGRKMHGQGSVWSYKPSDVKGRAVVTGSHPESVKSGEKRDLMAAMLRYAADGAGCATAKAALRNGNELVLDQTTGTRAGIGDKQYHHFTVDIPEGAKNIKVKLAGNSDLDLHLAMRKDNFAWRTEADIILTQAGCNKILEFDSLEAGLWYISVYCPAEITTTCGSNKFNQTGDLEALNGVPYSIQVVWE